MDYMFFDLNALSCIPLKSIRKLYFRVLLALSGIQPLREMRYGNKAHRKLKLICGEKHYTH